MGKIYYFNEIEDFFGEDEWKLSIDISDIWNRYNNQEISINEFNVEYYNRIIQYQKNIGNLGNDVWNDISQIISKLKKPIDEKSSISVYGSIYDWADKNDIHIKTK